LLSPEALLRFRGEAVTLAKLNHPRIAAIHELTRQDHDLLMMMEYNVMVTACGDVKVMDFGIARVAGSEHLTMEGYMMGTPAYMAPEQVRGEEVDRRMDLTPRPSCCIAW
jgi:serine/threonine protein kinase